jgi:hypothetical protein
MPEVARAAYAAPPALQLPSACDLLLDGVAALTLKGYAAGTPLLQQALTAFRSHEIRADQDEICADQETHWLPLACRISRDIWDDQSWRALSARLIELARQAGALSVLPAALLSGAAIELAAGQLAAAASRRRSGPGRQNARPTPCSAFRRAPLPAAPTGRSGSRRGHGHC